MNEKSPVDPDRERALARQKVLAYWLDDRFRIPIINRRIGLDGLIGLVPGVGDLATTALALFILAEAWRQGASTGKLARMGVNVGIDTAIGAIPILGDLFDLAWKSNRRNVQLLIEHIEADEQARAKSAPGLAETAAKASKARA